MKGLKKKAIIKKYLAVLEENRSLELAQTDLNSQVELLREELTVVKDKLRKAVAEKDSLQKDSEKLKDQLDSKANEAWKSQMSKFSYSPSRPAYGLTIDRSFYN